MSMNVPVPLTGVGVSPALAALCAAIWVILANSDQLEVTVGRVRMVLRLRRRPRSRGWS